MRGDAVLFLNQYLIPGYLHNIYIKFIFLDSWKIALGDSISLNGTKQLPRSHLPITLDFLYVPSVKLLFCWNFFYFIFFSQFDTIESKSLCPTIPYTCVSLFFDYPLMNQMSLFGEFFMEYRGFLLGKVETSKFRVHKMILNSWFKSLPLNYI